MNELKHPKYIVYEGALYQFVTKDITGAISMEEMEQMREKERHEDSYRCRPNV